MENYIKKLRADKGMSCATAGELVGVTRQAYSNAERNWPNITLGTLVKYAKAFGYKVKIGVVETSSNHLES